MFFTNDDILTNPMIRIWFLVELINFFVEPIYFLTIMALLKLTVDQQNEMQKGMKDKLKDLLRSNSHVEKMETDDDQESKEMKSSLMRQRTAPKKALLAINDEDQEEDLENDAGDPGSKSLT